MIHRRILRLDFLTTIHHNFHRFNMPEFTHFKCYSICSIRFAYSGFKWFGGKIRNRKTDHIFYAVRESEQKLWEKGIQCLESLDHQSTQNHNNLAFPANLKCLLGTQNRYSCLKNCLCKLFRALSDVFLLSPYRIVKKPGETDWITLLNTINSENKTNNINKFKCEWMHLNKKMSF